MSISKTRLLAFGALLAALLACAAPRLAPVAEISPPLIQEEVFAWSGQVAGQALFSCREGIGWVDAAGQIVTWSPEKRAAGTTWPLPFAVSDPPFRQGDFLALKSQAEDQWLVFDLARMETRFALRDLRAKQILGVDGDHLVYVDGENLVVHSRQEPAGLFRWPAVEKKFFKLGQNLERQPFISGGAIIIAPADNNVLRVSNSGSVRWWLALHSIPQFDLLPMADHLAAFLMNQEIKFINLRRQQETVFKINGRPTGMPLAYQHDLYFFLAAEKMQKLQRVGNQVGIELTLTPDKALLLGNPITFSILTNNLLKPRLLATIRDEAGQTVLTKKIELAKSALLVWIPVQAGIYRMHVSAAALNRIEEKEISFQVFDPREIFLNLYLFF
ncbi:MAG: hypothetical protein NTW95_11900 [Candidatus Aminicenantes bacterium]|nr:hypothetical protein [Candidatus Aminicenantes bacterium]